jgi:hypothetical protein
LRLILEKALGRPELDGVDAASELFGEQRILLEVWTGGFGGLAE